MIHNVASVPKSRECLRYHVRKVLCKDLEDIWKRDRDVCPETHKVLEWPGQESWNSLKWRQAALQGKRIVANVDEAHEVASAALPVFEKVLNDVSRFFFITLLVHLNFSYYLCWVCGYFVFVVFQYSSKVFCYEYS